MVGGPTVLLRHPDDRVALLGLGAGVTLHGCVEAASALAAFGARARVTDVCSAKPLDVDSVMRTARVTVGRLAVEDHYREGGPGAAVLEALTECRRPSRVVRLAVRGVPGPGTPKQAVEEAAISAGYIARAAARLAAVEMSA
ncbi:MAG: transketolase C-terminal domain-containing protein [Acidimicrobiales bacterium]